MMKHSQRSVLRILTCITALCLTVCALCACENQTTETGVDIPRGYVAIEAENEQYVLYAPGDWIVDTTRGMTSLNTQDEQASNLNVTAVGMDTNCPNAKTYFESYSEQFRASFTDFELSDNGSSVKLGGKDAYRYLFTGKVAGKEYKWMMVLCEYSSSIYILTYTSTPDMFDLHYEDVCRVMECFSFR